jgi:GTP-binding protein
MNIKSAQYITSSPSLKLCPEVTAPEFAFIGRSNVGKSTLINYLTNHSKLAKTSKTPGKTKLINHFLINNEWFLVDLPGYGYAKTDKQTRLKWGDNTVDYILERTNLKQLFILVDSNIPPQDLDLEFIHWCLLQPIAIAIVMTKIDKPTVRDLNKFDILFKEKLREFSNANEIKIFQVTANGKKGKEPVLDYIESLLS